MIALRSVNRNRRRYPTTVIATIKALVRAFIESDEWGREYILATALQQASKNLADAAKRGP